MTKILNRLHEAHAEGRHGFTVRATKEEFHAFRETFPELHPERNSINRISVPGHLPARVDVLQGRHFGNGEHEHVYVSVQFMLPSEL